MDLLLRWNRVYNLTAIRKPEEAFTHHLLDCLAVVQPMARRWQARALAPMAGQPAAAGVQVLSAPGQPAASTTVPARVLDVGSGGGLPGVVLAVVCPHWEVCCVDAVAKKASFVRQAAAELSLPNLRAEHARVENMVPQPVRQGDGATGFDWITSRAFASLGDFVTLTRPLLAPGGEWVAMKGRAPDEELLALPPGVQMFHVEPLEVPGLDAQRCLVWMRPVQA
jgi:16S rRNA (guanine527-N7)-methyltransferase